MYKLFTKKMDIARGYIHKILLVMRLTTILLLVTMMQVSAGTFAQHLTYNQKDATLTQVFNEIRKQTGYNVLWSVNKIQNKRTIDANFNNTPLTQVLTKCLENQQLTFEIDDKTVIIKEEEKSLVDRIVVLFQEIDVRGHVVDEKGVPIEGVGVLNQRKNTATQTGQHGAYRIQGEVGDVLTFSSVGYVTQNITISQSQHINVIMELDIREISAVEVISTGYQTLSNERSAGSFAKPDMDIVDNRSTSMNIVQRLDGLVPGLTINNAPGSEEILIRGLNSINSNRAPLMVVDGIPISDVSSINPQDVADITVLKDATAASIWGSRASNGVVVITTKKGKANEKLSVQYDAFINFKGKPDLHYIPTMNSRQFIQAAKDVFDPVLYPWASVSPYVNTGSVGVSPHEMILYNQYRGIISENQANRSMDSLAALNNVQQISDLFYRNASLMNHTVSLSGGGKQYSFYGSVAYTNTHSNKPGERDDSYKANLRQDFRFNEHIQLYLITDLSNTVTAAKRNIDINNRFLPYQLFKDANGSNISVPYVGILSDSTRIDFQNRSRIDLDYNPLDEFDYGYTDGNTLLNRIIGGATINLFKGLRFEGVYGYIKGTNTTTSYDDAKSYLVRSELVQFTVAEDPSTSPVYYLPKNGGRYSITNRGQLNWTLRNQLVYDNSWDNRLHQLTLLGGQETQEQLTMINGNTVRGYNEELQTYGSVDYATLETTGIPSTIMANNRGRSTLEDDTFDQTELQTRFTSYYANAAYTYNHKYSLNASWRIDQSNLFGTDKSAQNKPVWSIGGKWLLSEEKFIESNSWINRFALRATYGITGNSPAPGSAASYDILAPDQSNNFIGSDGLNIATPGNKKLTWESTKTTNIGVDFSVLDNRFDGSIDFYQKKTENLIGRLSINSFTGYSSITGNFGDMQNKGVELNLNSLNINTRNFRWSTLATIGYNKNVITKLNGSYPITTGDQKVTQSYLAGSPAFAVFAYQYAGLDTLGDPMIHLSDKTISKKSNVATPEDIKYMGTYQPVWSGGLSNFFSYKGLGLSVNVIYNLGYVIRRDVNEFYYGRLQTNNILNGFFGGNISSEFADRWKQKGDEAFTDIPSYVSNSTVSSSRRHINYYRLGDLNVINASYIKLRDVTLSYGLPKSITSRIKTDDITFRIQLSNIMIWKANNYGIDPEFKGASYSTRSMRRDQGTVTVGAHVAF